MFVRFHLRSNYQFYSLRDITCVSVLKHKFPSGKTKGCLNLICADGNILNFVYSDVCNLLIQDFDGQKHNVDANAKIVFVEDGQAYERS